MLDASGKEDIKDLEALLSAADALGPIRGYKAALAQLNTLVVKAVKVRDDNAAYAEYAPARAKVNREARAGEGASPGEQARGRDQGDRGPPEGRR